MSQIYTGPAPLVDTETIAKMLSYHPVTIRRWAKSGTIPSQRGTATSALRFDADAVRKALADRATKPAP